jgi:hypothetical protein
MTSGAQVGPVTVAGYRWSLRISADSLAVPPGVDVKGHVLWMAGI